MKLEGQRPAVASAVGKAASHACTCVSTQLAGTRPTCTAQTSPVQRPSHRTRHVHVRYMCTCGVTCLPTSTRPTNTRLKERRRLNWLEASMHGIVLASSSSLGWRSLTVAVLGHARRDGHERARPSSPKPTSRTGSIDVKSSPGGLSRVRPSDRSPRRAPSVGSRTCLCLAGS